MNSRSNKQFGLVQLRSSPSQTNTKSSSFDCEAVPVSSYYTSTCANSKSVHLKCRPPGLEIFRDERKPFSSFDLTEDLKAVGAHCHSNAYLAEYIKKNTSIPNELINFHSRYDEVNAVGFPKRNKHIADSENVVYDEDLKMCIRLDYRDSSRTTMVETLQLDVEKDNCDTVQVKEAVDASNKIKMHTQKYQREDSDNGVTRQVDSYSARCVDDEILQPVEKTDVYSGKADISGQLRTEVSSRGTGKTEVNKYMYINTAISNLHKLKTVELQYQDNGDLDSSDTDDDVFEDALSDLG